MPPVADWAGCAGDFRGREEGRRGASIALVAALVFSVAVTEISVSRPVIPVTASVPVVWRTVVRDVFPARPVG